MKMSRSNSTTSANHDEWNKYGDSSAIIPRRLQEITQLSALNNNVDDIDDVTKKLKLLGKSCDIAVGQNEYVEDSGFEETPLQQLIREDTATDPKISSGFCMLSSPYQGNFLKMLAEMTRAKDILEIGMFTGYGAVSMAESSYCENVVTLDIDPYCKSFFKERLAGSPLLQDKIRVIIGPAYQSLIKLKEERKQFDLVFIDANKDGYLDYYKLIMDNSLIRSTGTIACDNVLWSGTTYNQSTPNGQILHEFVQFVKSDERVYQMILPLKDGILLIKPKENKTEALLL